MKKLSLLLVLSLVMIGTNLSLGADRSVSTTDTYNSNVNKEYDFENNSYNISDEQIESGIVEQPLQQDKKVSFWSRIVNSSHFSSGTATRTWIPLQKSE